MKRLSNWLFDVVFTAVFSTLLGGVLSFFVVGGVVFFLLWPLEGATGLVTNNWQETEGIFILCWKSSSKGRSFHHNLYEYAVWENEQPTIYYNSTRTRERFCESNVGQPVQVSYAPNRPMQSVAADDWVDAPPWLVWLIRIICFAIVYQALWTGVDRVHDKPKEPESQHQPPGKPDDDSPNKATKAQMLGCNLTITLFAVAVTFIIASLPPFLAGASYSEEISDSVQATAIVTECIRSQPLTYRTFINYAYEIFHPSIEQTLQYRNAAPVRVLGMGCEGLVGNEIRIAYNVTGVRLPDNDYPNSYLRFAPWSFPIFLLGLVVCVSSWKEAQA